MEKVVTDSMQERTGAMPADVSARAMLSPFGFPFNPMTINPAVALAAATAIGFSLSTQMASAMLGAFQGAMARVPAADGDESDSGGEPNRDVLSVVDTAEVIADATVPMVEEKVEADAFEAITPQIAVEATEVAAEPETVAVHQPRKTTNRTKPAGTGIARMSRQRATPAVKAASVEEKPVVAEEETPAVSLPGDDLKLISGVGPKLEQVLNDMGVRSYSDIVRWSRDDIARIESELGFDGRIDRDDWIGQATAFMKGDAAKP